MKGLVKYLHVALITWKSMAAYQADTWLGAALAGLRVLLAVLLWTAVFSGRAEVGGYSLPVMITYALLSSFIGRLQQQDGLAWQLAGEVREGQFSKYLVHPAAVVGYFMGAGLGRWTYLLLVNGASLALWGVVFAGRLAAPPGVRDPAALAWFALLLPLGGLCMLLLNHMVALLSLKFHAIDGMMIAKGAIIDFLAGGLLPLSLLPEPFFSAARFTPFYFVVYYPVTLLLGRQAEPPWLAALVLAGWCLVFTAAGEAWFRSARKHYEGAGI